MRLGAAFAALIALLLGIGGFGLRRMREINQTLSDISGKQSVKLQLTRKAWILSNNNSRIMMEIFLVQDSALINSLVVTRSVNSRQISGLLAQIEGLCESEQEKQLLSSILETRATYVGDYEHALQLRDDEGKRDAATVIIVNDTLPALLKYHAAWEEFEKFQKNQVDAAVVRSQVDYARAHRLGSLLIMLCCASFFRDRPNRDSRNNSRG